MNIGIDARMLGPEQGGLGRYVEQLVYHLSLSDHANEYSIFLTKKNWDAVKIGHPNFKYKKILADIPWYGWHEQIFFPLVIKKNPVDIMHFPHWNVPLFFSGRFVVTIHDLLLLHYPTTEASTLGPISYWFKNIMYRLVLKNAVKRAQHILTTSEFTKNDIHKTLSVPLEKMTVTYQAPVNLQKAAADTNFPTITKPYVLYVGVAYPHKNLARLVEAWKLVQEKIGHAYQLVLAGKKNYFYKKLEKKIFDEGVTDIIVTDFVTDEELSSLYAGAKLYVFPSMYEGFGLPPLEAWTHNVPVAASNRACLPEILGEGAAYFDPESPQHMADVISQILTNSTVSYDLRAAARQELGRYSWKSLAETTLLCYTKSKLV